MSKNKSKNQQYIKTDIDYERLADAIVKAHDRIAKTETKEKESQEKAEHDEWFNIIGYVEYPENENLLLRIWHSVKNDVAIFKSVITFKAKDAKKPRLSFELIRHGTSSIYGICKVILYLIALFFLSVLIWGVGSNKSYGLLSIPIFLFARIIRIAQLEVKNLKDKELLNTIFSANMTFVGTILAALSIILGIYG